MSFCSSLSSCGAKKLTFVSQSPEKSPHLRVCVCVRDRACNVCIRVLVIVVLFLSLLLFVLNADTCDYAFINWTHTHTRTQTHGKNMHTPAQIYTQTRRHARTHTNKCAKKKSVNRPLNTSRFLLHIFLNKKVVREEEQKTSKAGVLKRQSGLIKLVCKEPGWLGSRRGSSPGTSISHCRVAHYSMTTRPKRALNVWSCGLGSPQPSCKGTQQSQFVFPFFSSLASSWRGGKGGVDIASMGWEVGSSR